MAKKNGLGRGLGALLEDAAGELGRGGAVAGTMQEELRLDEIRPNPGQPRREFDEEALEELASSIRSIGIVQPITVRELEGGGYEIVAGERRYRAAKMAGLETIPAYVRKVGEEEVLALALIENIQREDLNAMEIALSYERLLDECHLTQDELSERVGKKRATVANYLRLLRLPAAIQLAIKERRIGMGHARALLAIEDEETRNMVFEQVLRYDFSVRKVEEIARELGERKEGEGKTGVVDGRKKKGRELGDYEALRGHLERFFGARVDLRRNERGRGRIVVSFGSDEELERIVGLLDQVNGRTK